MYNELKDIPSFQEWKVINRVHKGWSSDLKYYIEDYLGNKFLLRISEVNSYNKKLAEFEFIKKCNNLSFSMSRAVEIGLCNNNKNVYILLTWVEGNSLNDELKSLSEYKQYKLGLEAGKILKSIHLLEVDSSENIVAVCKREKMFSKLSKYENSIHRIENDQHAIRFFKNNVEKINKFPPVYKHGDFHVGNLILTPNDKIGVIDFNRWEYGDRYEEFYKIQSFNVELSIPFSIGQIHGYFNGEPSFEFWNILAVYVAYTSLYSIVWAEKFGERDIEGMKKRCISAFSDYDYFKNIIPKWYEHNSDKFLSF